VNAHTTEYSPSTFKFIIMANDKALEAALLEVANSKVPNYSALARKYNVDRTTRCRRARSVTVSRAVATNINQRFLPDAQEEVLLQKMEYLSKKGIYLALRIIRTRLATFRTGIKTEFTLSTWLGEV
jgi:hypothetical protein